MAKVAGITPAYAGKSREFYRVSCLDGDHPRLCGEKHKANYSGLCILGSPPPMRGKGNVKANVPKFARITPAYAGKRKNFFVLSQIERDHPRLCGEKSTTKKRNRAAEGSPPPMRGKDEDHRTKAVMSGITPAYAGKSKREPYSFRFSWDHPRLCGEKSQSTLSATVNRRITPAYAGKSFRRFFARSIYQDHPRLCGEKLSCLR